MTMIAMIYDEVERDGTISAQMMINDYMDYDLVLPGITWFPSDRYVEPGGVRDPS